MLDEKSANHDSSDANDGPENAPELDQCIQSSAQEGLPSVQGMIQAEGRAGQDSHNTEGSPNVALNERRKAALAEVDNATPSWFHAKVVVVAGVGFFTDSYDIFAINIATTMLGYVYGGQENVLAPNSYLGVTVATLVGNLVGQLFFGSLADVVGRKRMYGVELMIMVVATFTQAVSGQAPSISIIGVLILWRFILGVGIGGDYPLSAVISSEFASTKIRGRLMAAVFVTQGWGNFAASLVALIVVAGYKDAILNSPTVTNLASLDSSWRLLIGLGCIPACVALYFRLTIPETPRFTMDVERNVERATADFRAAITEGRHGAEGEDFIQRVRVPQASWSDFVAYFSKWKNGKVLLGASWSWFALDVAFYGLSLNSSIVLERIGFGTPITQGTRGIFDNLMNVCIGNLILAIAGMIPGYYATFLFIDSWGRKPIQLLGFSMLTVIFVIMGFGYDKLIATPAGTKAFVFLYCLANFFFNFGPNSTTFIIPGEAFPTRYRSTGHGISAACGKLGAVIAQVGFAHLVNIGGTGKFLNHILEILAFFMLTGVCSTLLLPETKLQTLEELSNETQEGFIKDG